MDLQRVFDVLMHQGLTTYKTKNSMAALPARIAAEKEDKLHKKGAVFAVRSKKDFQNGVSGFIIKSKEALLDNANSLTHFTPNIFGRARYLNDERTKIGGFEEKYLNQINTFVVDIDTKEYSVQEILVTCMDESIGAPTMILESDRGFQVYFILDNPFFISSKNDFRGLKVAKRISDNIKRSLSNVAADIYCNDFGFFRIPTQENVVWFQEQYTYAVSDLIRWSVRQDDDFGRSLYVVQNQVETAAAATSSEWFRALINAVDVEGKKGQIGRNNMLYTLALICYSEGKSKESTFDLLDMYNSNLKAPLNQPEVNGILRSAFSGKKSGASKSYVEDLLSTYVSDSQSIVVHLNGKSSWYKFKKERADRVRSHLHEWEDDILMYINKKCTATNPFIELTQKELCEEIGIASSSLNKLMKQSTKLIKRASLGRSSKTAWSTAELVVQHVLQLVQAKKNASTEQIKAIINDVVSKVTNTASKKTALETLEILSEKGIPMARHVGKQGFG